MNRGLLEPCVYMCACPCRSTNNSKSCCMVNGVEAFQGRDVTHCRNTLCCFYSQTLININICCRPSLSGAHARPLCFMSTRSSFATCYHLFTQFKDMEAILFFYRIIQSCAAGATLSQRHPEFSGPVTSSSSPQSIPRPAGRHSPSSASWVFLSPVENLSWPLSMCSIAC